MNKLFPIDKPVERGRNVYWVPQKKFLTKKKNVFRFHNIVLSYSRKFSLSVYKKIKP